MHPFLNSAFTSLHRSARRLRLLRRQSARCRFFRPRLETLEDRRLLAVTIHDFVVPTANSEPFGIVAGPDGNIWFTEQGGKIGRMNLDGVVTAEFPVPNAIPLDITVGADGNLWFVGGFGIGRLTPTGGYTQFSALGGLHGIAPGPDGNLWVAGYGNSRIGKITPSGVLTIYTLPSGNLNPTGIVAGPDGNLWFTLFGSNKIGRITPSGSFTAFPLPTPDRTPTFITAGSDGSLWFTERSSGRIGRMTTTGTLTEFPLPTANGWPYGITAGPDGNIWFTYAKGNKIGRITTSGVVTEFVMPTPGPPLGGSAYSANMITAGPDGKIWFTQEDANKIGRVTLHRDIVMLSAELQDPTTVQFTFDTLDITSPFDLGLYLSADQTFDPGSDVPIGSFQTITPVGGQETGTLSLPAVAPDPARPYVLVVADPLAVVHEEDTDPWNEDNLASLLHTPIVDTVPPRVTAHTPAGDIAGSIGAIDVWFSERINKTTFQKRDVTVIRPDNQMLAASSVQEVGLNRFRINFPTQTQLGTYHIHVGPDVHDFAANRLDQDRDGLPGEPGQDVYDATFNLVQVDLGLSNLVVGAGQLTAGELVEIFWQGMNRTGSPLQGDWLDAVYLSTDDRWDINDVRLAIVPHSGGLAANETYSGSATVAIPGRLAGNYHILVRADVANQERETNEADNLIASPPIPLTFHTLLPGGAPAAGALTPTDRADYYAITVAPGDGLRLSLSSPTSGTVNELYISRNAIPTRQSFDHRAAAGGPDQHLVLTGDIAGGTFYVLVHGAQIPDITQYTLSGNPAPVAIDAITPQRHGNSQSATVTLTGAGFDEATVIQFVNETGQTRGVPVRLVSSTTLSLHIDFNLPRPPGVPENPTFTWTPGVYSVRVTKGSATFTLPNAFELLEGGVATLETSLVVPSAISPGFPVRQTVWMEYRNTGTIGMPAPLLRVAVSDDGLLTANEAQANAIMNTRTRPVGLGNSIQVLGVGSSATPGTLQPGESGRIPVYYVGLTRDHGQRQLTFSLGSLTVMDTTVKAAYVSNPDERIVFELPRNGRRDVNIFDPTSPRHITRLFDGTLVAYNGLALPNNTHEEYSTIDWIGVLSSRPDSISVDAWGAIVYNLRHSYFDLWADYVGEMAENANQLAAAGQFTNDLGVLWGFEVAQASAALSPVRYLAGAVDAAVSAPGLPLTFSRVYGQDLPSRFRKSVFGRGWTHNWDITASIVEPNSDVVLHGPGGVDRFFTRNLNGTYTAAPGDFGKLTFVSTAFRLTETDGTIWQFGANNKLSFVEDTNGNRITLGYTDGFLTSLTHSSGQQILLEYDMLGLGDIDPRLLRVIDTAGSGPADDRVTSLAYDSNRQHLIRVTAPGGQVTAYDYHAGTNNASFVYQGYSNTRPELMLVPNLFTPTSFALRSVTHPDGTHDFFTYDGSGRLIETSRDGGLERITFGYAPINEGDPGQVVVTDATGGRTTLQFGLGGQMAQVRDGDGRIVHFGYDQQLQVVSLTGPGGERYRYSYDATGNLTGIRDALNLQTSFRYEPAHQRLSSFADARGNGIDYQYDVRGNLTAIIYEDGSRETFTYDARGNVLTATNRRGQLITYTYNAAGQVTSKDYDTAAGVEFVYNYDGFGNLTAATDFRTAPPQITQMAYQPDTDLLTRIEYPDGKFFAFTYDLAGRRTRRTDQDGNVVNYAYDNIGRLDVMTSAVTGLPTESLVVDYDYDAAGRLARKTLGNGVHSTYEYDDAGHIVHLINHRPDEAVLSRFDYTYDVSGRRTSMTANEGTYTYDYDALGQLVGVIHPDGHAVHYDYDEAGNRRQVIDDGVVTTYTTNKLNQYLTVGDAVYQYDLDGNLISKLSTLDPQLSTLYTYDIENRLVRVETASDVWEYAYDAFGNRIAATHNGDATRYIIDPTGLGNVAAEYDGGGSLIARYEHGFGLLARSDAAGNPAFYTFSAIGHTSELTDPTGAVANAYAYDPFGLSLAKTETIPNPFEFVGEFGVMNEGNGLEFMRARFYAANAGRFLSPDPINISGGFNLYAYANSNPIEYLDPEGTAIPAAFWVAAAWAIPKVIDYLSKPTSAGMIDKVINEFEAALNEYRWKREEQERRNRERMEYEERMRRRDSLEDHAERWERQRKRLAEEGFITPPEPNPFHTEDEENSQIFRSYDPNDKLGPSGYGSAGYLPAGGVMAYQIRFENQPSATAPAQRVTVTDTLDPNLDLSTFELTEIAFANQTLAIPAGLNHYEATLPIQVDGTTIHADIRVALDRASRLLTFTLEAIDPLTGWMPENPLIGLLYPNDDTARGEGSISYLVKPNAGLPSGTRIENRASIIFDFNDPIETPLAFNTLDAGAPTSHVTPLPETTAETDLLISWAGADDAGGSGAATYDLYVSDNSGPFFALIRGATSTSIPFIADPGHTYAFYTVARDHVGHVEAPPLTPDAMISIALPADTTGPEVLDLVDVTPDPRAMTVEAIEAVLSEPLDLETLDVGDVVLRREGVMIPLSGLVFEELGPAAGYAGQATAYRISGLGTFTQADGAYELRVEPAGVTDLAGNPGVGSAATEAWLMDATPPAPPQQVAIAPDTGRLANDAVTMHESLTLSGALAESGLLVRVRDMTRGVDLGLATVTSTTFQHALLLDEGEHQLRVAAEDAAGNSAEAFLTVFVDRTAPQVEVLETPAGPRTTAVETLDVTFETAIDPATLNWRVLSLRRNGGVELITSAVTVTQLTELTYRINGLATLTTLRGSYELRLEACELSDLAGNAGVGASSVSWENVLAWATSTTLESSPNPSPQGEAVTLTARVAHAADDGSTPAGSVTFRRGTEVLGVRPVDATGMAQLTVTSLAVGPHTLTAEYSGDMSFAGGLSNSVSHTVEAVGVRDVTTQVNLVLGGFRYNRTTRSWLQTVSITNTSGQPLAGPVSLVLGNLSSNARLIGPTGSTSQHAPLASPYRDLLADLLGLNQTITITLEFDNPTNAAITYKPRVLAGPGTR